jgi:hypothetical protein
MKPYLTLGRNLRAERMQDSYFSFAVTPYYKHDAVLWSELVAKLKLPFGTGGIKNAYEMQLLGLAGKR